LGSKAVGQSDSGAVRQLGSQAGRKTGRRAGWKQGCALLVDPYSFFPNPEFDVGDQYRSGSYP